MNQHLLDGLIWQSLAPLSVLLVPSYSQRIPTSISYRFSISARNICYSNTFHLTNSCHIHLHRCDRWWWISLLLPKFQQVTLIRGYITGQGLTFCLFHRQSPNIFAVGITWVRYISQDYKVSETLIKTAPKHTCRSRKSKARLSKTTIPHLTLQ